MWMWQSVIKQDSVSQAGILSALILFTVIFPPNFPQFVGYPAGQGRNDSQSMAC